MLRCFCGLYLSFGYFFGRCGLFLPGCLCFIAILSLDFEEQFSNLADFFLLEMDFSDNSGIRGSDFSKLFIRCYVSKFLKLFNFVAFGYVNLLNGAFFDFLSEIGKIEFDQPKAVSIKSCVIDDFS
jgi:hypothetical protein